VAGFFTAEDEVFYRLACPAAVLGTTNLAGNSQAVKPGEPQVTPAGAGASQADPAQRVQLGARTAKPGCSLCFATHGSVPRDLDALISQSGQVQQIVVSVVAA
jgi:hypothetical protein